MTPAAAQRLRLPGTAVAFVVVALGSFWLGHCTASRGRVDPHGSAQPSITGRNEMSGVKEPPVMRDVAFDDSASIGHAWTDDAWRQWMARPASLARNQELAARLTLLARTDPVRAMQLAEAEKNLILREKFVHAALSGWAAAAPSEAAGWVYSLDDQAKRSAAMETVFASCAASQPDEAVKLGRELFQQDPGGATGYGCSLVDALCAAGHFEKAVALATDPGALDSTARSILLTKTYSAWAAMQPEQAGHAAAVLADPAARTEALNAVVGGWGQVDPAGLTQFVAQLPAGPDRIPLMGQALRAWSQLDAAAAAQWVKSNDIGPGMDDGVAAMAGAGFLAPNEAAVWSESIASPALRSQTLLTVLRNWSNTDPAAARAYFEKTPDLQPVDRALAAALFTPPGK
ncbi:MAG: hypothetical protein QM760_05710 [Nibricoccus sp.]